MPIQIEDRMKLWSSKTTVELRQKSIMYNLLDKSWEQDWINGASEVPIPVINWDTSVSPSTRAQGADWASNSVLDQSIATLKRSGGYSARNDIPWDDVLELPWPVIARVRSRQVWAMRNQIDRAVYAGIAGTPSMTIVGGTLARRTWLGLTPYGAVLPLASGTRWLRPLSCSPWK